MVEQKNIFIILWRRGGMNESYLIKKIPATPFFFFLDGVPEISNLSTCKFLFFCNICFVEGEFVQLLFAQNWNDTNSKAILINF